ncbi:unnamed protein product [Ceratitis capitata]|uniref:(Mediterranean fruit fly) hypothetical protein n=1 Tax=Ceratitis capitata TaxID=7213 RepID=A0A811U3W6_CERCA|nr:unnamed protein product [Ceratitis capitata]
MLTNLNFLVSRHGTPFFHGPAAASNGRGTRGKRKGGCDGGDGGTEQKTKTYERRIKQTMPAEVDCSRSNNNYIGSTAQQLGSTIEGQTANAVETR